MPSYLVVIETEDAFVRESTKERMSFSHRLWIEVEAPDPETAKKLAIERLATHPNTIKEIKVYEAESLLGGASAS